MGGDPISAGSLDVKIPYLQETQMGGIPYLQETQMAGIPYLQEARCELPYLQETWG